MNFKELNISQKLLSVLDRIGFDEPTPIQATVIPKILAGRDVLAVANTGTGKTGAFLIPLIDRLIAAPVRDVPHALILVPTRELALQIGLVLNQLNDGINISSCQAYGGVPVAEQIAEINRGVELLIATPGRLVDLLSRDALALSTIQMFILDEADRMLDMGFSDDLSLITSKLPTEVNTLLFSATMAENVKLLSEKILKSDFFSQVSPSSITTDLIDQQVYYVEKENKNNLLTDFLRKKEVTSAIVFTKTRKSADRLNEYLQGMGLKCDAIHSDRSQNARNAVLASFRENALSVLIATDIAARGIDVSHVTHVFNYELPQEAESYVHRIGRTGRAGKSGTAITLCAPEEKAMLIDIQKWMKKCIPVVAHHTYATLSLTKALQAADDKIAGKKEKNRYKGNKANGDFYRRQKLAQKSKR